MEEKIYLMDPLPYGGNVLPFIVTNGDNYSFRVVSGVFDFRDKTQPSLKSIKMKCSFDFHSVIDESFPAGSEPLSLHHGRLTLYNLMDENYKGLLNPKDKIILSETNISALLVFISAGLPKQHSIWDDFLKILHSVGSNFENYADLYINDDGNCWTIKTSF